MIIGDLEVHRTYAVTRSRRAAMHAREWGFRHALERWVSELTPCGVYHADTGDFLGLTAEGHSQVYVTPE